MGGFSIVVCKRLPEGNGYVYYVIPMFPNLLTTQDFAGMWFDDVVVFMMKRRPKPGRCTC
jgi:hypothetical protein